VTPAILGSAQWLLTMHYGRVQDALKLLDENLLHTDKVGYLVLDRISHSRLSLDLTLVRLKLGYPCDQWHSSQESTLVPVFTINVVPTLKVVANPASAGFVHSYIWSAGCLAAVYTMHGLKQHVQKHYSKLKITFARCSFLTKDFHSRIGVAGFMVGDRAHG
jgi:hypothetical protein